MNRLYHYPLSPFSRKVRLCLAEKKIEVELVEERYWEQSPEFLRRNPAGMVPVLKHGNLMMSESQAICEYLEETNPNPPLMPRDPEGRYEALWRNSANLAVVDHNVPTTDRTKGIADPVSRLQVETLDANAEKFKIKYFDIRDHRQGIVHVIGPEDKGGKLRAHCKFHVTV